MSENTNQSDRPTPAGPPEDEISLVDLLAVIVRHRRLIIGVPLVVGLAAALYLYALPALGLTERPVSTYEVRKDLEVATVPEDLKGVVPFDPVARTRSLLKDVRVVGPEYAELFPDARAERTDEEYNTWIREEIIGEHLSTSYDGDTEILSVTFRGPDLELAEAFLDRLYRAVRTEVVKPYLEELDETEERISRRINSTEQAVGAAMSLGLFDEDGGDGSAAELGASRILPFERGNAELLGDLFFERGELRAFREQMEQPLAPTGDPVVFVEEGAGRRSVRLLVAVLTAGFLSVFLAFVLEYARGVSRDPEESAKLKSAWRRE